MIEVIMFLLALVILAMLAKIVTVSILSYIESENDDSYDDIDNNSARKEAIEDMADEFNVNYLCYDNYFKELSL